ncbi:Ger(x)C family spore germination protein [Cohnella sp. JJ-181]|uniref:Ger(x)C family spore germination protein n=1 Tax=Cohnella rhizoplanae TaxID=2974897 RepID=UPI0022FFB62C|nr:Ger(x)C family spore germination protein [Cohnella sp. JJ-181]CAI6081710.1 Spore germination protein B3 [Cohnella sp. JJ-181]
MNRVFGWTAAALLALPVSGCWSKLELNDRSFITSAYVDVGERPGEVTLTIGSPLPNRLISTGGGTDSSGNEGQAFTSDTQSAATIPEALAEIQKDLTRKLTWGQIRAVIVSEEYASQNGLQEVLEWISRNPSFPLRTYFFVSEGQARKIMELTPVYERSPSEVLRKFGNRRFIPPVTVKDLAVVSAAGVGIAVPVLRTGKKPLVSEKGKESNWVGISGGAMIQDMRMKGRLEMRESKVVGWTKGRINEPMYDLLSETGKFHFRLNHLKAKISPSILSHGDIVCRVQLRAEATLEYAMSDEDISRSAELHKLEREMNASIVSDLKSALDKSQSIGADILALGRQLEWRYPRQWARMKDKWPQAYGDEVRFKVQANVRVTHMDAEHKPMWSIQEAGAP